MQKTLFAMAFVSFPVFDVPVDHVNSAFTMGNHTRKERCGILKFAKQDK